MHHSRLCAVLIDCRTADVDEAARFWGEALGRPVDHDHSGSRGNYRMLETPPDEPIVQIQRVDHESRVHIDIETDDIRAEVTRLERLGAKVVDQLERWMRAAGWESVLNRAGTTFRKLPEADRSRIDERRALALMLAQPSMIKRPVLEAGEHVIVGFRPEVYEREIPPGR